MARLQILVNHYREPEETVARFLGSLASQEGVDWGDVEVLVRSDGTALRDGFMQSFGIPVRYEALPHSGVCHTRNVLMDAATADYLMFCDVDDRILGTRGVSRMLKAIDDVGTDVIVAPYEVELPDGGYRTETDDTVHVFSKAFRRAYLVDNDIRFPDEMETCGDMHFTWLAFNLGPTIAWMRDPVYVWAHNEGSVTRSDPWHRLESYGRVLRCYEILLGNLASRGRTDLQESLLCAVFSMAYVQSHDAAFTSGPERSVGAMADAISGFAARHGDAYLGMPRGTKEAMLDVHRRLASHAHGSVDDMDEWVRMLL